MGEGGAEPDSGLGPSRRIDVDGGRIGRDGRRIGRDGRRIGRDAADRLRLLVARARSVSHDATAPSLESGVLGALAASNVLGVVMASMHGVEAANDEFLRMTGFTADEVAAGQVDWQRLTPDLWRQVSAEAISELVANGYCRPRRKEYTTKDGAALPVRFTAVLLDREPLRWLTLVEDLTEQDEAQREVVLFSRLVESSSDLIGIASPGSTPVYLNAAGRKLLGVDPAAPFASADPVDYIHPLDRPRFDSEIVPSMRDHAAWHGELRMRHQRTGDPIDVRLSIFAITDEQQRVIGIANIATDIRDRKQVERELARLLDAEHEARQRSEQATARLQQVQEISDTALAALPLDLLLSELLERLRDVTGADTARILLVTPDGEHLAAGGSLGLGDDLRDDVKVPFGKGFAGRVAATGRPWIVDDLREVDTVNPVLKELGVTSLVGVPLRLGARLLGVLHVGSFGAQRFGPDDVELLELAAERISVAIDRSHSFEREREARARSEFLAELDDRLARSLDPDEVMEVVAAACVPRLGPRCQFERLADGEVVAHSEVVGEGEPGARRTVPLRARGTVFGRLHGEAHRRDDDDGQLSLLHEVAARAAVALDNACLYEEQRTIAHTLQQSLLPRALPSVPGIDLAARYLPAGGDEVGGDFYDVLATPEGGHVVLIGDVCGKGVAAAAVTALARHTLRAAALCDSQPEDALRLLHRALLAGDDRRFCTAIYARMEAVEEGVQVRVTSGGHPLPVVADGHGTARQLGQPGTLLGMPFPVQLAETEAVLVPGDVLVLYTDGLTDLPPPAGVLDDELIQVVAAAANEPTADAIANTLVAFGDQRRDLVRNHDDVAIVVVRVLNAVPTSGSDG